MTEQMTLTRHPEWEARLNAWLEQCADKPHAWGSHDCVLFAAGVSRAVTGFDPGQRHRGQYRSAAGSSRYLRSLGWDTPEAAFDAHYPRTECAMAQRGDLVLYAESIGVCLGGIALFVGEEGGEPGLVRVAMNEVAAAWKLG